MKIKTILSITMLLLSSLSAIKAECIEANSKEVYMMLQQPRKWVIIDVRTFDEYHQGHIKGALNIDIRQPDALQKISKLDRNSNYIVHCRTNHRSKVAVDYMVQNGFKIVYQMTDGMNGWILNNFPNEK
ncbi:MAG: rhodanese-like domain-containing protein [Paludibacter sp.]|nr:rhodanese-like domain-containing protein [Paludibacter sp.]